MNSKSALSTVFFLSATVVVSACSSNSSSGTQSSGGSMIKGGAGGGAGTTSSGSTSIGGNTSPGGATATAGTTISGGNTSPGGATATAGTTISGGNTSPGGATASGGATAPGGATASGGTTGAGGSSVVVPSGNRVRGIIPFDASWLYHNGDATGANGATFADGSWRSLSVPHDWAIEGTNPPANPFSATAATTGRGAWVASGIAWYRKHFTLNREPSLRLRDLPLRHHRECQS
ncbi:MAG: hypothetical protein ABSF35_20165 [Polyangia bacterium]